MNKILCSIIIPYYNIPTEIVNKCLNSILKQNWDNSNFEIIFINDGSTIPVDKTTKKLFQKFTNFTLIEQENKGLSSARNVGIQKATGKYLFFIDSDDFWIENQINHLIPFLKKETHDIIKFKTLHIRNNQLQNCNKFNETLQIIEYSSGNKYLSSHNVIKGVWTYCFNRQFILSNNIFMPEGLIHEDEHFLTLAFLKAKKCIFTNIPLYAYIKREDSITTLKAEEHWEHRFNDFFQIIKMTIKLADSSVSCNLSNNAINNRLSYLIFDYLYNLFNSPLNKKHQHYYLNLLSSIKLYPLPKIGNNKRYNLLRLFSKNAISLKMFIKFLFCIRNLLYQKSY